MKQYRKRLIGVILLGLFTLILSYNAIAEETTTTPPAEAPAVKECKNGQVQDIESRYNLKLEKVGAGQYKVTMAGDAADIDTGAFKIIGTEVGIGDDEYEGITGPVGTINAIETIAEIKKGQDAYFNATPATAADGAKILAVKVQMVAGSSLLNDCDYTGRLVIKDYGDSAISNIFSGGNTQENSKSIYKTGSICYNFYNGIWNSEQFVGIKESDFNAYNYQAAAGLMVGGKSAQAIYQTTLSYCFQQHVTIGAEYSDTDLANMIGNAITYTKSRTQTIGGSNKTFAQLFEEIKTHANVQNKSGKTAEDKGITCDWQKTETTGDPNDYYKNKNYYYKEEQVESISVQYTYNYAPGDVVTTPAQEVCTRTCAEAVKVEYGPPVASKAGLCFEYNVKVTSYVECTSDIKLDPPVAQTNYCSPVAFCHEKNWRWSGHQAGPTEEFDACIQECDGGKYTSKCSKKCYKKVYKNSKLKLSYENDIVASRLSNTYSVDSCIATSPDGGCYYWSGNDIMWKSSYQGDQDFTDDVRALGRWYREVQWYVGDLGAGKSYDVSSNGIKTKKKTSSSTGHCQDVCYWKTDVCKKGQYLNPNSALEDYQANLKLYQSKVAQCEAATTCSSSTATFTISINYDSYVQETGASAKTKKKTTINFPRSPLNQDKLPSHGKDVVDTSNTFNADGSTLLSYNGCYTAATEKNWYQAEWGFPGTYIHNKTGEISYSKDKIQSDTGTIEGWYYDDNKFCMPLEAESVNTKWWEWYKINNMQFNCYTSDQIKNELSTNDGTSNGYNIHASTTDFGYFGWDFDISCFYALRNELCDEDTLTHCCKKDTCVGDACETEINGVKNYMFRAIDTNNVFPNAIVEGVTDETKRPIGFNWTNKAANSKNPDYLVNPANLIEQIENRSETLYTDDNLDYQFHLTPEVLWKIKEYNKETPYGTWNGRVDIKNGIYVYFSNLWGEIDSGVTKTVDLRNYSSVLKTGTPGVNNEED